MKDKPDDKKDVSYEVLYKVYGKSPKQRRGM